MNPHVLILASHLDFSTDLVTVRLQETGVPYVRLNREDLAEHRLTLDPLGPELAIDGPSGTHRLGAHLGAVWYRQPVFLRNTPGAPLTPKEQLERSQWMGFLRGLCVFQEAAWMNSPIATYIAESKPYQLAVAARCGFEVPSTLATNDGERMRSTFPSGIAVKSLDTVLLREGDDCLFTYTTLNPEIELDDSTVKDVPVLAQRALESKCDLRVTIVGEEVFAVRVLARGEPIPGDWRRTPKQDLEYHDCELDPGVAKRCRLLTRRLGLSFAAIDLIENKDGTFFIEVNPTGEWGWLSNEERPIDVAIATWLGQCGTRDQ